MVEIPANWNCHSLSLVITSQLIGYIIWTQTNLLGTYFDAWMIWENSPNEEATAVNGWKILTWKSILGNRVTSVRSRWIIWLTSTLWAAYFRISQVILAEAQKKCLCQFWSLILQICSPGWEPLFSMINVGVDFIVLFNSA